MRTRSKLLMAAIAAIAVLGTAVTSATASRLEVPNFERGFRIQWTALTLEAAGVRIVCPVTLSGSFSARSIVKRAGERIGAVTAAAVGSCTEGAATALTETLPWEVTYNSFEGTLPSITGVRLNLVRSSFQASNGGITCLARTEVSRPARGIARVASGAVTGFRADETATISTTGGFFCTLGGPAHFAGEATFIRTSEGGSAIELRLI